MQSDTSRHISAGFSDLAARVLEPYPTRYVLRLFVADLYNMAAACLIARRLIEPEDGLPGRAVVGPANKAVPHDPVLDIITPLFERAEDGSFYLLHGILRGYRAGSLRAGTPHLRVRRWIETEIDRRFRPDVSAGRRRTLPARLHAPQDELAPLS